MELGQAMRSTFNCRYYLPDPVADEVFHAAVEVARFGPQGGNRQPVRFLIVRDPERKRALGELYLERWRHYRADLDRGRTRTGVSDQAKAVADADAFAAAFGEHPAIVVVCADLAAVYPTDAELGRLSIVGGASVYPIVQNLCLALRDQGVATTFTTLLVACEAEVKRLLEIPDRYATACHLVAGYPARGFPRRLRRRPVEEIAFVESFAQPLRDGDAPS